MFLSASIRASGRVYSIYGVIPAVRKHIVSEQALAGGNENIGVDEAAPFGVVITALEIIQPGF